MVVKLVKYVSTDNLRKILKTVNTRTVKEIIVKECSNHIPFKLYWYEICIGYNTYIVDAFDMDDRYTEDAISYFEEMIQEFKTTRIRD